MYTYFRGSEALIFLIFFLGFWPVLLHKMSKSNRDDFRYHRLSFICYTLVMAASRALETQTYLYLIKFVAHQRQDPQNQAYLAFKVIGFQHLLVPLAVVLLKKNKDIFMSFSKLQALAQVSGF